MSHQELDDRCDVANLIDPAPLRRWEGNIRQRGRHGTGDRFRIDNL